MALHPITKTINKLSDILIDLGFIFYRGKEIDTEYNNFDALNVEKDHPARDAQDTFWLPEFFKRNNYKLLPRTHTSNAQIDIMSKIKPPFKTFSHGKVFRNEATDATHEAEFHQIEGMFVGENISIKDAEDTLYTLFTRFFGQDIQLRFRASFFPFVKPGFEVDIFFNNRWLEICGAGMIHKKVLENGLGEDFNKYSGFAFGIGVERIVMVKNAINDIRDMSSGDIRFSSQFK